MYFGIVDLKYDEREAVGKRLRILELGNGLASRFSGYGESCLDEFKNGFRLVRPLERNTLVDNKKFTHDVFDECDLNHLRPLQAWGAV